MMKFIDNFSFSSLIFMAIVLAVVPYPMQAMPHSLEKIQMLLAGQLVKSLDIFDLFMHTGLIVIVMIKSVRYFSKTAEK